MGADPTVHAATTEDLDGIRSVARVAWHEVYDDLLGERTVDRMLSTGYADDVLERIAGLEDVELFVAEVDDRVAGYASCDRTDTVGLGDLDVYLYPDYWGEGVGERLLERGSGHLSRWASDASATGCSSATRWGTPSTGTTSSTSAGAPTSAARRAW